MRAWYGPDFHQVGEHPLFVPLAGGEEDDHWLTTALGPQLRLGPEAAPASSQGFIASPLAGACRMLMGTDDGAVNKMEAPVQLASGIGLLLEACQDVLPDTRCLPAVEPAGNSLPRP